MKNSLETTLLASFLFLAVSAGAQTKPITLDASKFPSLQAAFDAVPESGGLIFLPPGDYEITKPVVLSRENVRLEGAGSASRIINKNEDGQPALVIQPAARATDKKARIWRVQVANFRISGNPKSGDGLRAEAVNEILIQNLSIDRNGAHGINLIDCYENPRIATCNITYNGLAGLNIIGGHDIVVNANQFEENQDAVRCIDSFNLCMNGNNIDDHLRHGVVIENTYGSVLSGNMIEECNGTAIVLDRDCYGITISANVIAHHLGGGVELRDAWGCAVSANTFTLVHNHSILVGPDSGRITITGNNFSNSHIGGKTKRPAEHANPISRDAASGIILKGTSDIVITGNLFSGLDDLAIKTEGDCQRVVINANVMTELGLKGKTGGRAMDTTSARDTVISDNIGEKKP